MTILPLVAALLFNGVTETVAAARAGTMARRTLGLIFGFLALILASINIFGGFMVTSRMLAMYKKKDK